MMHICFFVEGYPTPEDPFMPFVRELIARLAKLGVKCSVIVPQSITRAKKQKVALRKKKWIDHVDENTFIEVYQPYYVTFSNKMRFLSDLGFVLSAKRAYKKLERSVDVLYAHFWRAGILASKAVNELPLIVACGESEIKIRQLYSERTIRKFLKRVKGAIYVSEKSHTEAVALELQEDFPYIVAPNGYDSSLFYKRDKEKVRKELGIPKEVVVGCFVGAFIERKGIERVRKASMCIDGLKMIYIGRGEKNIEDVNCIFCGSVAHEKIPNYLSAADFFVLPSLAEGCSNAIVEALACELPVISSNLPFNNDILNSENSLLVDPLNIKEIYEAMRELYENIEKRNTMSIAAKKTAKNLEIDKRAQKILEFISSVVKDDYRGRNVI